MLFTDFLAVIQYLSNIVINIMRCFSTIWIKLGQKSAVPNYTHFGEGWKIPMQLNQNKIKIDFDFIDPKDFLTLSLICSINPAKQKEKGILPKVTGYISETRFYEKSERPKSFLILFVHLINILNIFIFIPVIFLIDLFEINLPSWYWQFSSLYWIVTVLLIYLYFLTIGRKYIIDSPKIILFYIKQIFKISRNKVQK